MILRYLWPNQPLYLTQRKTKLPFSMVQNNITTKWTRPLVLHEIWWAPSSCIMCISERPFSEKTRKKYTPSSWHYMQMQPCHENRQTLTTKNTTRGRHRHKVANSQKLRSLPHSQAFFLESYEHLGMQFLMGHYQQHTNIHLATNHTHVLLTSAACKRNIAAPSTPSHTCTRMHTYNQQAIKWT